MEGRQRVYTASEPQTTEQRQLCCQLKYEVAPHRPDIALMSLSAICLNSLWNTINTPALYTNQQLEQWLKAAVVPAGTKSDSKPTAGD